MECVVCGNEVADLDGYIGRATCAKCGSEYEYEEGVFLTQESLRRLVENQREPLTAEDLVSHVSRHDPNNPGCPGHLPLGPGKIGFFCTCEPPKPE